MMASSSSPAEAVAVETVVEAAKSVEAEEEGVEEMTLTVRWSGKDYTARVCGDDTVGELKRRICEATNVLPKRQKLLYPKLGSKLNDDFILLSHLQLKPSLKMTMIGLHTTRSTNMASSGDEEETVLESLTNYQYHDNEDLGALDGDGSDENTVEDDIIVEPVDAPEIMDDFELGEDVVVDAKDNEINKMKLRRRARSYKVELLHPCREGKKLLVLDIDYTLFDHRSTAENPRELMRPYLHEFLSFAYAEYDIMIWSATSMKWVELKMGQLGVLNNPNYKITALLDHMAMITIQTLSRGIFDCKPLGLIWAQFPQFYSSENTIMFDDLRRNFVMNPQNGLTIKPFRKAHLNRGSDRELVKLTQYLLAIAELDDLSELDHSRWESYADDTAKRPRLG